jgi:hypothetical protein
MSALSTSARRTSRERPARRPGPEGRPRGVRGFKIRATNGPRAAGAAPGPRRSAARCPRFQDPRDERAAGSQRPARAPRVGCAMSAVSRSARRTGRRQPARRPDCEGRPRCPRSRDRRSARREGRRLGRAMSAVSRSALRRRRGGANSTPGSGPVWCRRCVSSWWCLTGPAGLPAIRAWRGTRWRPTISC